MGLGAMPVDHSWRPFACEKVRSQHQDEKYDTCMHSGSWVVLSAQYTLESMRIERSKSKGGRQQGLVEPSAVSSRPNSATSASSDPCDVWGLSMSNCDCMQAHTFTLRG